MIEKDIEIEIIQKLKTNIITRDLRFLLGTKLREFSIVTNYSRLLKYNDNDCLKIKNSDQNYEWPISYVFPGEYQFYRCNDILEREQDFEKFLKYYLLFLQMDHIVYFDGFEEKRISQITIGKTLEVNTRTYNFQDLKEQGRFLTEERRKQLINELKNSLADYYTITDDFKVIPVDPVVNNVRQIPECKEICRYYDQNDIKSSLVELRRLYEEDKFKKFTEDNSNEVNFIYKFVIKMASIYAIHLAGKGVDKKRIQQTEFTDRTEKLQNALNEYKNTNGIITNNNDILEKLQKYSGLMFNHMIDQKHLQHAYQDMTETEARIWFDLGLSIYRLYLRK